MHQEELVRAVRRFGSQDKLSRALGVQRTTVNNWLNRGTAIPIEQALRIEMLTNGEIKAEALVPHMKEVIFNFKDYLHRKFKEIAYE